MNVSRAVTGADADIEDDDEVEEGGASGSGGDKNKRFLGSDSEWCTGKIFRSPGAVREGGCKDACIPSAHCAAHAGPTDWVDW